MDSRRSSGDPGTPFTRWPPRHCGDTIVTGGGLIRTRTSVEPHPSVDHRQTVASTSDVLVSKPHLAPRDSKTRSGLGPPVREVHDTGCFDDASLFEGRRLSPLVEEPHTSAKVHGHKVNHELIEKSHGQILLRNAGAT